MFNVLQHFACSKGGVDFAFQIIWRALRDQNIDVPTSYVFFFFSLTFFKFDDGEDGCAAYLVLFNRGRCTAGMLCTFMSITVWFDVPEYIEFSI
ncbi:hypothetical protein KC358_g18 [Hortaea werneckii]|nr:hypothetical protein KC358_g18 [Hortaea werneckii]